MADLTERMIEYQCYLHHKAWSKNYAELRSRDSFRDAAISEINAMTNVELLQRLDLMHENPTLGTPDARYNR